MVAIDTNILLYALDNDFPKKMQISIALIDNNKPVICSQNISEFVNFLTKVKEYTKSKVCSLLKEVLESCVLVNTEKNVLVHAIKLAERYQFQLFDAIIVEAGCDTLYTEDMQHGLVVEKKLKIINPFL